MLLFTGLLTQYGTQIKDLQNKNTMNIEYTKQFSPNTTGYLLI